MKLPRIKLTRHLPRHLLWVAIVFWIMSLILNLHIIITTTNMAGLRLEGTEGWIFGLIMWSIAMYEIGQSSKYRGYLIHIKAIVDNAKAEDAKAARKETR